jgi:thiosulfate/3-mercaptopyruvate sulfurtransferase
MSAEGKTQLVDARGPAGYLGVAAGTAGVDPRWSGHIPGARNVPMTLLNNDVGPVAVFFDADTQRKAHELMGVDPSAPTTTYCNTGVMASLGWYVLSEVLGNSDVRLYDGSMQDWTVRNMPVNRMQGI